MVVGLVFAVLAVLCGLAVNRALGAPLSVAPFSGLACIAVMSSWCAAVGALPAVSTGLVVVLALAGVGVVVRSFPGVTRVVRSERVTVAILAAAVAIPWLLLGLALVGVDAPVSTHDGAFHVESVDNLRRGVPVQGWYPMAFHGSVAAVLRLMPWLDTARGTVEAAQALAVLAPVGVFSLGLALGLSPRIAAIGGVVQSLTYTYPYDDHVWGGWPLATSILLLLGLWSVAARWIVRPTAGLAILGGLLAGAIVLAHGTEVYSALIGLSVIVALRWRRLELAVLGRHVPLAIGAAVLCAAPYASVLLGWAAGGGASAAGAASLDDVAAQTQAAAFGTDWLEFLRGLTGAASPIDLPVRGALLLVGARHRQMRPVLAAWIVFAAVLFVASFVDVPATRWLYVATFPWLVHYRPPQMVVLFASLLVAGGVVAVGGWAWSMRARLATRPNAWRRLAVVGGALLFFFVEGSAVSIFKTLDQVITEQNVYLADDRAAMAWLRQNALPGEMVINDLATDAGIWAPYKAGLPVLLPRSAPGPMFEERGVILAHVLDLDESAGIAAQACQLHADYLYQGSRTVPDDVPLALDRAALERAPGLQEVFSSGDAAIYRVHLACS